MNMADSAIGREDVPLAGDGNSTYESKVSLSTGSPSTGTPFDSLYDLLMETANLSIANLAGETALEESIDATQAANDTGPKTHPMFPETWLMPAIFSLIFLVGVTGNFLVIFVILKHKRMRTTTNFYILSLAISDFSFLLFCVPFTAAVNSTQWYYGSFMCKFSFYLINVSVQATCITLTAMMVDRYYAISHPLKSLQNRTPTVALMVSLGIWIASLLMCIPVAQYRQERYMDWYGTRPFCIEAWPSPTWELVWYVYMFVAAYLVPLLIISVCIGLILRLVWKSSTMFQTTQSKSQRARQRKKIRKTRMVCVVILIFSMCWLPVHIVNIIVRVGSREHVDLVTYGFQLFSNCLSYANSCVNPIIYAFMSENFRRRFKEVFSCCRSAKKSRARERGTIIIAMADGKPVYTRRTRSANARRLHSNHCEMTVCDSPSSNPFMSDSDDSLDSPVMRRNGRHNFVERAVRL
ncbi:G-protein coupled receptor 54-like [Ptychodera flava]|uniref:G-protein coupled receptor 54-like n=1 Tax=Ptychodera flava TaxID=63121 RepID=UPI00396A4E9F